MEDLSNMFEQSDGDDDNPTMAPTPPKDDLHKSDYPVRKTTQPPPVTSLERNGWFSPIFSVSVFSCEILFGNRLLVNTNKHTILPLPQRMFKNYIFTA